MFNLRIDYPSHDEEVRILSRDHRKNTEAQLTKVWTAAEMIALQRAVRLILVPQSVAEYAVSLVQATRPTGPKSPEFVKKYCNGAQGRAHRQYLALAGKSVRALDGRFNVAKEDIQRSAKLVLRHRIITKITGAEADHRRRIR